MKKGRYLCALIAASFFFVAAGHAVASEKGKPHWGYEGDHGPSHWGGMSKDFEACSGGKAQSPIDIAGVEEKDLADIEISYKTSKLNIINNGHTVQVNYDSGSSIKIDGKQYQLVQFHFHDPSEHTVGGKFSPMEVHFVHKDAKGDLAVIGVMINAGKENAAYKDIWANLPQKEGAEQKINATINATDLLPASRVFYRYAGSLTTPPCTEGVDWSVLKSPIEMSEAQIDAFKAIVKGNNRPVQSMHGRKIMGDAK
ncbi:MAG: carbonic anhydrase [Deltaproteobacteria bacterium]